MRRTYRRQGKTALVEPPLTFAKGISAKRYRDARRREKQANRSAWWDDVVARACGRCEVCGRRCALEADHIVPRAQGGTDTLANGAALCIPCHRGKHPPPYARRKLQIHGRDEAAHTVRFSWKDLPA